MKILFTIFTFLVLSISNAQSKKESMINDWSRAKAFTIEYLEAMPDSSYDIKPNDEVRSFASQMLHLSDAIYGFVGMATNTPSDFSPGALESSGDVLKSSVIMKVANAYDFGISAIQSFDENQLGEMFTLFGQLEISREQAIRKCFEHQTHHRGQTAVYLRMAGVTPPSMKLF